MTTMQKVLLGGAIALFLLCVGAGLFGYYRIIPRFQATASAAVQTEVAQQVQRSMENALVMHTSEPCTVRLAGHDLDISTYTDTSGSRSIDVVNDDATIVNGEVEILADGIAIMLSDIVVQGAPQVQNGAFTLDDVEVDSSLAGFLFDTGVIATGFEEGINEGLRHAQLAPVSVELADGVMIVGCEPLSAA